ncbi:MAG: hypothetical protein HYY16_00735 [Planctomycetes bacterium]|nr:hypothetical protein [Planctomycetota bacterium]
MLHQMGDAVRETRKRVRRAWFWDRCTQWLAWGWLAAGAVALFGKLSLPEIALGGLAAAVAWAVVSMAVAMRTAPSCSLRQAAVLLDRRGNLGGWPLVAMSFPESGWAPSAQAAPPGTRSWPLARRLLPAVIFLVIVLALPQQSVLFAKTATGPNTAAAREVERLTEQLETLAEKEALPPEELDRLKEELRNLAMTVDSESFSQEGWEGLDHLTEQMHQAAHERAAKLAQAGAAAGSLSLSLAEELDQAQAVEKKEALEKALMQLPGLQLPQRLQEKLDEALGRELETMNPQELQDALEDLQEFLDQQLQELSEAVEDSHPSGEG